MIDIYKASAGSGKTYTLARRFIALTLGEKQEDGTYRLRRHPRRDYRYILAITFTNKATEEMKRRIVHELAVLASLEPGWTKPSPYIDDLCELFNCRPDELREPAAEALHQLLFDFNYFNVSTIDAFFQSVLRTFAREADLTGNYEIELDSDYVINMAVAQLMSEISKLKSGEAATNMLMNWVIQYMKQRVNSGNKFNVLNRSTPFFSNLVTNIKDMIGEDFNEIATALTEYIGDDAERLKQFSKNLNTHSEAAIKAIQKSSQRLLNEITRAGGGDPRKAATANLVNALTGLKNRKKIDSPGVTVRNCAIDGAKGMTKGNRTFLGDKAAALEATIQEACQDLHSNLEIRHFIIITTRYLFLVGLIGHVVKKIKDYCAENNVMLLQETNHLLSRIIGTDDAPVVYERMGLWLNHFLIDEFQDTSRRQWHNIRPLIAESLATSNDNLIIGDEKQCIYRFRNSDPELLHTTVDTEFQGHTRTSGNSVKENTNWRSSAEVVRFNNTIFATIARTSPQLSDIYSGVVQQVSKKHRNHHGYVRLEQIDATKAAYAERTLEVMGREIKRQLQHYHPGQIAVLCRHVKEARAVISYLFDLAQDPEIPVKFNVVSEDSLYISSSPAVRYIVSVMRFLTSADAEGTKKGSSRRRIAAMINRYELLRTTHPDLTPAQAIEMAIADTDPKLKATVGADVGEASDPFAGFLSPSTISLGSLVEHVINTFLSEDVRRGQNVYLSAFQDIVAEYCERGHGDITSFMEWWKNVGQYKTLSAPEDDNAIHVMTIHKSKGLEFNCVHIPFGNWDTNSVSDTVWVEADPQLFAPYTKAETVPPLLPIKISKDLKNTPFEPLFRQAENETLLDEVNVAYVGFTRAIDELIVQYNNSEDTIGSMIVNALKCMTAETVEAMQSAVAEDDVFIVPVSESPGVYTVGAPTLGAVKDEKQPTAMDPSEQTVDMPVYSGIPRPYIWDNVKIDRNLDFDDPTQKGIILHNVLRHVGHIDSLVPAVEALTARGAIPREHKQEILEVLSASLADERVRPWFEGYSRLMVERKIVTPTGLTRIPDRVVLTADGTLTVIDYKTGEVVNKEHLRQVRDYMQLIEPHARRNKAVQHVRGFVWYLVLDRIDEVEM